MRQVTDFVPQPGNSISTRAVLLLGSAVALGTAIYITRGFYSPLGIALLSLALLLCAVAAVGPGSLDHVFTIPVRGLHGNGPILLGLLLFTHLVIGIVTIRSDPRPNNDVWVFHTDSANALRNGINPYSITFPNIYYPDTWVYAPKVVKGDRLLFGYPYPPLTLAVTSAGHLALGDPRYAMLLCMAATGMLIWTLRPDFIGVAIAAIFLFTPSFPFVLDMGWTEPVQALLLAGVVVCAIRAPGLLGIALGLLIASKQYMPIVLVLFPLSMQNLDRRKMMRDLLIAAGIAILVTVPLALWDLKAFTHSVITLQLDQPFRKDALSYLNLWRNGREGWIGPFWVAFAAMGISIALCYWRRIRFPIAAAFCFFMFFAFNKQAFANYYYFVVAALCIAAAGETLNRGARLCLKAQ